MWDHVAQLIGRWTLDQKVLEFKFSLLVMCRSVGQIAHSVLPLLTQWRVLGGTRKLNCNDWLIWLYM